jgi:hypothetical protein
MKKLTATAICLIVLSMGALPLAAQTRTRSCNTRTNNGGRYNARYEGRTNRNAGYYDTRYDNDVYRDDNVYTNNDVYYGDDGYVYNDNRSFWDKHRDKITTVAGAVGGAAIGGMIGGKKGAVIGAVAGGASTAIYTYKIRDKYNRY